MAIYIGDLRRYAYRQNRDRRGMGYSIELILGAESYANAEDHERAVLRSYVLNGAPHHEAPIDEVEIWHRKLTEKPQDGRRRNRKELAKYLWEYKTEIRETRIRAKYLLDDRSYYVFYPGSETYKNGIPDEYRNNENVTYSYEPIDRYYTPQELANHADAKDRSKPQNALVVLYEFDDLDKEREFRKVFERLD